MIKTFEEFINENYNEMSTSTFNSVEYGAPLFDEISESLVSEINNSINEGKLVIDTNMIEEGIFDAIGSLFKKGGDITRGKINSKEEDINFAISWIDGITKNGYYNENNEWQEYTAEELAEDEKELQKANIQLESLKKIEEIYSLAEELCKSFAEKEENMYKTISEKMSAANEAIKEFTENAIAKIKEIIEVSSNKVGAAIAAVVMFFKKMAALANKSMETIVNGSVLAFTLPFVLTYSIYKGVVSLCETLAKNTKEGAKYVKEMLSKIKTIISNWVVAKLNQSKELLVNACKSAKEGAQIAYKAIGKAYLAIVAMLGQLASDAKDAISDAYNKFVDGVKEMSEEVKTFVSEKWDTVSKWCKKTATAFADGVKNVWEKVKGKVMDGIESAKDAYQELEDEADATWNDVKSWGDKKQQDMFKAMFKYASDKWGADEVKSWF